MTLKPPAYGPALSGLLEGAPLNELGPGKPDERRRAALAALRPEMLGEANRPLDREMALACLAGLWLRWDFLDESHRISQDLESATGSYWHGIMHRREGDFGNAKYWFRRVGGHPIFDELCAESARLARDAGPPREAAYLAEQPEWDPFKFVDLCQRALDGPERLRTLCRAIQQREWELLFDYCYKKRMKDEG